MDLQTLIKDAKERFGFEEAGALNVEALEFLPEVRQMCAADRCRSFNRNWSCPPGCGTLEEIAERVKPYTRGILVQSIGQLEDEFDVRRDGDRAYSEGTGLHSWWNMCVLRSRTVFRWQQEPVRYAKMHLSGCTMQISGEIHSIDGSVWIVCEQSLHPVWHEV